MKRECCTQNCDQGRNCHLRGERRVRTSRIRRIFWWIIAEWRSGFDRRRKLDELPGSETTHMRRRK